MNRFLLLTFSALAVSLAPAQTLPAPEPTLAILRRVNDRFLVNWPNPGTDIVTDRARPDNIWTRATYFEGLMALHRIAPDARYVDYAVRWGESHRWGLAYGSPTNRNADDQCCGQTYLDLYALDPRPERIRDIKTAIDTMVNSSKRDDWWWIDALQMAMPLFARFGVLTGDARYFTAMHEFYSHTRSIQGGAGLYHPVEHLWWRDADFNPPYQEPNGANCYWARGNGWVFAALVRVLDVLPANAAHRAEYLRTFQEMAAALVPLQRTDGFWNVSLLDPDNYGGRELTGTAFFTYGMAWGVAQGHLNRAAYLPVVARAWQALANHAVRPDGTLAYVQGSGKQPSDSQPVTSDSAPNFDDFGTGAFLLAGSEVHRLASTPMIDAISVWRESTVPVSFAPDNAASPPNAPQSLVVSVRGTALANAFSPPPRLVFPDGVTSVALSLSAARDEWSGRAPASGGLSPSSPSTFPNGSYTLVLGADTVSDIRLAGAPPEVVHPGASWPRAANAAQAIAFTSAACASAGPAGDTRLRFALPPSLFEHTVTWTTGTRALSLTLPPYTLTPGSHAIELESAYQTTARTGVELRTLGARVAVEAGSRTRMAGLSLVITGPTHSVEKLVNVSARGAVSAEQPLIAGFTISPGGPKMVLIRAVGPALQAFGVAGALANPSLRVFNANRTRAWQNDDWQSTPQYLALDPAGATTLLASYTNVRDAAVAAREAGAFPLAARSRDAALVLVLPPGGYTAQVIPSGAAAAVGPALVEVYELTTTSVHPRLTNLSTRGLVAGAGEPLTAGFVVQGGSKTVLLRALGPALVAVGLPATTVLADPQLTLFRADGTVIATNDQWGSVANLTAQTQMRQRVGAFPLATGSKDAELAVTLPEGAYTVQATAADGGAGVALIEIYAEPPGS